MKKGFLLLLSILVVLAAGCSGSVVEDLPDQAVEENPLLGEFDTPFGVPPFDKIKTEHFLPAITEGIRMHEEAIETIVANPAEPTFENTIAALDYSSLPLDQVQYVFYNYLSFNYSDELEAASNVIDPLLTDHSNNVILNEKLFARIAAVYALKDELGLTEEEAMLLEVTYRDFAENGAALAGEDRDQFREINEALSELTLQFGQNIFADVNSFELYLEDEQDLSGLPEAAIEAAREAAAEEGREDAWLFTLQAPSIMALLTYADNRDLRQAANEAYIMRGRNDNENNNEDIVNQVIRLRLELARLLGHENFASYALTNNMTGNPQTVEIFLLELLNATLPAANEEAARLQELIDSEGAGFELAYWDWRYYAEKVRREQYAIDETELRQYFELGHVLDGLFTVIENLWGLRFVEQKDLPLYHPETLTFAVLNADGSHLGILYLDLFPRPEKQGGASMNYFRPQYEDPDGKMINPVLVVACNFTPPSGDKPALLSYDEIATLYHEFGHALHALLSNVRYPGLSGTSVPRDFVELPSQLMENWARHPEVLKMFARHYESGAVIPDELIEKLQAAAAFNKGFATLELLASALLDYHYHTITEYAPFEIGEYETALIEKYKIPEAIYFRHGSTHFQHIMSWGYSASYYSYLWAGVLDADAFEAFLESGDIFDKQTAEKFRTEILERGGTREAMDMYLAFRGKEPDTEALLRQRGLK
jgi:peptidyl-dipeptidase Dcp